MNPAQLEAMQAGKRDADARRRILHTAQIAAFREWLRVESRLFSQRAHQASLHGRDSAEFLLADEAWRASVREMPPCPPDSAWDQTKTH